MYKIIYLTTCLLLINIFISCNVEDTIPNLGNISKNTDNSLTIIYNGNMANLDYPSSHISIVLFSNAQFILEVDERATLQYEGTNLTLVKNQYIDNNKIISDDGQYIFTVIAQNGDKATYTIDLWIQRKESKEILDFRIYNEFSYIMMDINANSQIISKTVTNVEGITNLFSYIVHSGSNISPISGIAQDFSTNNVYTVTATDMSKTNYTVSLTNYYKVTIKTNGGNIILAPVTTKYILYGEKVPPPSDPSQEHYGFKGWYNAPSGGNTFSLDTPITTQTTIYAQWTNKQYRVRFYLGNNLLDTVLVTSLAAIPALNYPTSSAMGRIYEWYRDSGLTEAYDKSIQVTNDLDLYGDEVRSFGSIIDNGSIPTDLANYDNMSELIFSNYTVGATVVPRYVKEDGIGDGTSWDNASGDIQAVVDGMTDANDNKVYVVLVASGHYQPIISYALKNHVALVGGFMAGSYDQIGETHLDGNEQRRLFYHNELGLNNKAILYGVVIKNGLANEGDRGDEFIRGGGMYNKASSPTLIKVTFLNNTCNYYQVPSYGGGMYNENSSPTLIKVTFSGNKVKGRGHGGGMYNEDSSPFMSEVDFINNIASSGGGMYNKDSSPTLIKVTFSGNITEQLLSYLGTGGGMYNSSSSPALNNVTFSGNTAGYVGGGMYNSSSSPALNNVTFSGNTAGYVGGGMYNSFSSPALINITFSGNVAEYGGGIFNAFSSPALINITFSGNEVNESGGGIYNYSSSSTLINVTFSSNTGNGGGVFHDGDEKPLTLINTILWNNDNGNIFVVNNNNNTEPVNLYYSLIEGGTNASNTATGIRLYTNDTIANPININSEGTVDEDPRLDVLIDNGGEVDTISIGNNSPAKDKGIYVRGVKAENTYPEANLYYSENNTDWYSDPGLTTQESLPSDADDLTATDARGYSRAGRPDMGAYEEGGIEP